MQIKEVLDKSIHVLKKNKIENPIMHARILLEFVLKKNSEYIIAHDNEEITETQEKEYINCINELANGKPLQHITNHKEFMMLDFYVDENVLIPRADTEILVEEAIEIIKKSEKKELKVLDMCTGSGAIAISIAHYITNVKVYAVDISEKALNIAKQNARKNNVENKCEFIKSDMFENICEQFDMIISNPPYIRHDEMKTLDLNVQNEPTIALDGGFSGLDFYKILADNAYKFLNKNGKLLMEIGYSQKKDVINLLEGTNQYKEIYSKNDLSKNDRIVVATKK